MPLPVLSRMELMLDELVTNIIVHGYRHDHGRIELQAQVLGQALHVTLRDYAFAYDPLQAPEPDTAWRWRTEASAAWACTLCAAWPTKCTTSA